MTKKKTTGKAAIEFEPSRSKICKTLGIRESTLLRWISNGAPHQNVNGVIVVDIAELKKYSTELRERRYDKSNAMRFDPPLKKLCEHFNVARQTISQWVKDGLPCEVNEESKIRKIDVAEVEVWLRKRHVNRYKFI